MSRLLDRLGRNAARHSRRVVAAWLAVAIVGFIAAATIAGDTTDTFEVPGVDSQVAAELLEQAGDDGAGVSATVVIASDTEIAVPVETEQDVSTGLAELEHVTGVDPPITSADGSVVLLTVRYPVVEELDAGVLDELVEFVDAGADGARLEAGGELFFIFSEPESAGTELIGLGVAIVVLFIAFGSFLAAGLPIAIALGGLALSTSTIAVLANVIDVPSWAGQLGAMIGLGVGIDYALFVVSRHRELLAEGLPVERAVGRAVATAGQAVVFAGSTVVVAILGLAVAGIPAMTSGGVAISIVVLVMVIAAITLLPALLGLAGHRIEKVRLGSAGDAVSPRWQAWGRHVSAHPWTYAIGVTTLLLALTAPVLDLRLGFPDEGTLGESRTERRAYDLVTDAFGPGTNGPLLIAVDLDDADPNTVAPALDVLQEAIAADEGVAMVSAASIGDGVATLVATPTTSPQDPATFDTVERLRTEVLPVATDGSGVTAHVGGATATFGDAADRVADRLAWFIVAVIGLSFLLLMVLFRSVLVPLKAALLNLVSIGAAYGVLVAVFQWGWGASLIGLETTVPIVSFIPMFMFAVVFGLSMDYEVFLLSRVREEYVRHGDNDRAVVTGIATTARVITSAALIMISVFGGFAITDDPVVKMMGLGLATAIFVDATIVRLVLVPATMTLMGRANWWLPTWLDRVLPHVDVEGAVADDEFADTDELDVDDQAGASRDTEPLMETV